MTTINQLSKLDKVNAGDLVPVWATNKGDDRAAAISVLQTYMQDNLTFPRDKATQTEEPNASGFTIQVNSTTSWLLLKPTAAFGAGTITLPAEPIDKDQITISTTETITSLTINSTVVTIPRPAAALNAHTAITMKYDAVSKNWYVAG